MNNFLNVIKWSFSDQKSLRLQWIVNNNSYKVVHY